MVKKPCADTGDSRDGGSIPGLRQPRFKVPPPEVRSSADGSHLGYCLPHLYTGPLTRLSREMTVTAQ